MLAYLVILLSISEAVLCNDLRAGYPEPGQQLILQRELNYKAISNPNGRIEIVDVETDGNSVINNIEVMDMRDNKDGFANITSGGIGQKFVSILLKAPGVFRDMMFDVKVYAIDSRMATYRNGNRRFDEYNTGAYGNGMYDNRMYGNGMNRNGMNRNGIYNNEYDARINQQRSAPLEYGAYRGRYVYDRQDPYYPNYNRNY